MTNNTGKFDFSGLVAAIQQAHEYMAAEAGRAVSISLTLRNWLIGRHIWEHNQNGADRADYGSHVSEQLGDELQKSLDRFYLKRALYELFVSRYQLELPRKEEIQRLLEAKMREVDGD